MRQFLLLIASFAIGVAISNSIGEFTAPTVESQLVILSGESTDVAIGVVEGVAGPTDANRSS